MNSRNERIVVFNELQELSGYDSVANVVAWMEREGIVRLTGKHNRPSTTIDAINVALGIEYAREPEKRVIGL
jgi:hypothetical protein